jgi:hypothetical protein
VCLACGTEFTFAEKLNQSASTLELIASDLPQIEAFKVDRVVMVPHTSKAGNETIKVAYYCGFKTFYEYLNFEANTPLVKHKSRDWFRQRYHYQTPNYTWDKDCPDTNAEVLKLAAELRWPKQISVWVNKQMPEIMAHEF